jgi:nuclear transport factor 2 (NTF2) superfamily protein
MSDELKNRVQRNKRLIFDAEAYVYQNVALVSISRGRSDENIVEALKLYSTASNSNRELIMRMTDDVYRNRMAILEALQPATPEQTIFKTSMINRSRIENLDHRSKINRQLIEANDKMLEAYRLIKEATALFSGINDVMVEHCDDAADRNAQYFDGELAHQMQQASDQSNAERVNENMELIAAIRERAQGNRERLQARLDAANAESTTLASTDDRLESQRSEIMALREKLNANQHRVAETIYQL